MPDPALKLSMADESGIRLTVDSHGKDMIMSLIQILVAVGRSPNVEGLNPEQAGVV